MNSIKFDGFSNFNGSWDFRFDVEEDYYNENNNIENINFPIKVSIPGYWDDYLNDLSRYTDNISNFLTAVPYWEKGSHIEYNNFTYLRGTGTYIKKAKIPFLIYGNRVIFVLSEVLYNYKLYINSKLAYVHSGHRSMVKVDVTDFVHSGIENSIVIKVNNNLPDKTACPYPDGFCGGILGFIGYYITNDIYFDNCFVFLNNNELNFEVILSNQPNENTILNYEFADNTGVVYKGEYLLKNKVTKWCVPKPDIKLWNPGDANLYEVTFKLVVEGSVWDNIVIKTGLRHLYTEGRKIIFNKRPFYVRANCHSNHYPNHCSVPHDPNYHILQLDILKNLGFNSAKYLYSFPPQVCLDYADEIGMPILISVDIRPKSVYNENDYITALKQMEEYINSIKHHPSISIIRLSGESYCYDFYIDRLKGVYDVIKKCTPQILVLPSHAPLGVDYGINTNDKDTYNKPYLRNVRLFRKLLKCTDVVGHYPNGVISYQCPGPLGWEDVDKQASVYDKPMISHELGMKGSYIDIRKKGEYNSRLPQKYVYDLEKDLKENGLIDKAEIYYKMSCLVQQEIRKYCIEETRLCRTLAGYEYLGAFDHFAVMSYPCGFADEFMQLKYGDSYEKNRMIQTDTVIILDFTDRRIRCFSENSVFHGMWTVSHFGQSDINDAKLCIEMIIDNSVFQSYEVDCNYIPNGKVCYLTPCIIKWPACKRPTKVTIRATLCWLNGETRNMWDFFIYPVQKRKQLDAHFLHDSKQLMNRFAHCTDDRHTQISFTTKVDEECIKFVEEGGKLVVLTDAELKSLCIQYALATGHSSNKKANVGTYIKKHPLTDCIPHDGYAGWQFYPIMSEKTSAVLFNNLIPYDPLIQVISSEKEVRKQGILFEYNIGRGSVLVFTGDMIPENPACDYFMNRLIEYTYSCEFNPSHTVTKEQLLSLRKNNDNHEDKTGQRKTIYCNICDEFDTALELKENGGTIKVKPISSGLTEIKNIADQDYMAGAGSHGTTNIDMLSSDMNEFCVADIGVSGNKLFIYFQISKIDMIRQDDFIYPDRGSGKDKLDMFLVSRSNKQHYIISRNPDGAFVTGPFNQENRINVHVNSNSNRLSYDIVCPLIEGGSEMDVDLNYSHLVDEQNVVEIFKIKLIIQ